MKPLTLILVLNWIVAAQNVMVNVKLLAFPGLHLIQATDSSVSTFVSALQRPGASPEIAALLPFSFVLENNTGHTISAYTLRLTFVDAQGKSGGRTRQYFNLEPQSNGMEIPEGATRLVTPVVVLGTASYTNSSSIGPSLSRMSSLVALLHTKSAVALSMDLVVFDTGQVIGVNEANTLSYLTGYVAGEREAATVATNIVNGGQSLQTVSDTLDKLAATLDNQRTPMSFDALSRANQARRIARLAQSSSSREAFIAALNKLLSKQPFTFYR